uniref:Uncharacterized protein n=1 Tax=Saimiri boliviensis boliviensis TaxID=39432 RepID=A0A2K6SBN5_SAIBB
MAAPGDVSEPPSVPSPVSLSSPGTPGAQHHEPRLLLRGHQHGSSPEVLSQPSDLDLQDIEEVEMGRDTFWPGES